MLRIPIEQTQPGMILARSVPDPENPEHTFLKAGFELDNDHINSLHNRHIHSLWIRYPNLDFLDELIDPEIIQTQQELYGLLKESFTEAQEVSFAKINYNQYISKMAELFQLLINNKHNFAVFVAELQDNANDIYRHGTIVASIAMLIGMNLESILIKNRPHLSPHLATDLTMLGTGALLHDIGKISMEPDLRSFHLTAMDHGSTQWQAHTEVGFQMIKAGLDPTAGQIVINHHQHYDGSGFPPRKPKPGCTQITETLEKNDIHVFCRIAAIADRFDNFRYLPNGQTAPAIVALKRLKNPGYAKWFDPEVYKAFFKTVPPFVPGDQVTLNNGQSAVIKEINEKSPCKPIVQPIDLKLAVNPDQDTPETPDINLITQTKLQIKTIGNFDITPYLFE